MKSELDEKDTQFDEKAAKIESFRKEKELVKLLAKDGRVEDIVRMDENLEVIEQLMKEYFEG